MEGEREVKHYTVCWYIPSIKGHVHRYVKRTDYR